MPKKETSLQNLSETTRIRVEELKGMGIKDWDGGHEHAESD